MAGPVFLWELIRTARHRWHWWARALYLSALLALLYIPWSANDQSPRWLAEVGSSFYRSFSLCQLLAVLLLAPIYAAGSLTEEKTRRTLPFLLASALYDAEIVWGKLWLSVLRVGEVLLCGLPLSALCLLLGGTGPELVFADFAVVLFAAWLGCALAVLVSVWCRRLVDCLLLVYLLQLFWYSLPAVEFITARAGTPLGIPDTVLRMNAFRAITSSWSPGADVSWDFYGVCVVAMGLAGLICGVTAWCTLRLAWQLDQRGEAPGRRKPRAESRGTEDGRQTENGSGDSEESPASQQTKDGRRNSEEPVLWAPDSPRPTEWGEEAAVSSGPRRVSEAPSLVAPLRALRVRRKEPHSAAWLLYPAGQPDRVEDAGEDRAGHLSSLVSRLSSFAFRLSCLVRGSYHSRRESRVWDAPVLWRELRCKRTRLVERLVWGVYFVAAAAVLGWMVWEWKACVQALRASTVAIPPRMCFIAALSVFAHLSFLALPYLAVAGATAFAEERDGKMFDLLMVTDLEQREIVGAKVARLIRVALGMLFFPVVVLAILMSVGYTTATGFLLVSAQCFAAGGFAVTLGLAIGLRRPKTIQAVGITLLTGLAGGFFVPLAILMMNPGGPPSPFQYSIINMSSPIQCMFLIVADTSKADLVPLPIMSLASMRLVSAFWTAIYLLAALALYRSALYPTGPWRREGA